MQIIERASSATPFSYLAARGPANFISSYVPTLLAIPSHIVTAIFSTAIAAPVGILAHSGRAIYHCAMARCAAPDLQEQHRASSKLYAKALLVDLIAFASFAALITAIFCVYRYILPIAYPTSWQTDLLLDLKVAGLGIAAVVGLGPISALYADVLNRQEALRELNAVHVIVNPHTRAQRTSLLLQRLQRTDGGWLSVTVTNPQQA